MIKRQIQKHEHRGIFHDERKIRMPPAEQLSTMYKIEVYHAHRLECFQVAKSLRGLSAVDNGTWCRLRIASATKASGEGRSRGGGLPLGKTFTVIMSVSTQMHFHLTNKLGNGIPESLLSQMRKDEYAQKRTEWTMKYVGITMEKSLNGKESEQTASDR